MTTTNTPKRKRLTASSFEALPDAEKDRIYNDIDARAATIFETGKPLTARQKKVLAKAKKKMGRPMLGKHGAKIVSVTVEKDLLRQADAYAKANGMKRSELFSVSVREKISG